MTRPALSVFGLCAALGLSACAGAPSEPAASAPSASGQCFWADRVNGFSTVDRDTLRVSVGPRQVYELEVDGAGCFDIDRALSIGVRPRSGGTVCHGYDAEILYETPGRGPQRCAVTGVRRVSEAELEAEKAARRR